MHKFNTLKYGGGAVTLLPQHVAQRMVRHVSKRNGWNGIGRFGEEVQDNSCEHIPFISDIASDLSNSRSFREIFMQRREQYAGDSRSDLFGSLHHVWRKPAVFRSSSDSCQLVLFRYACGGRNHLLTEVAA